MMRIFHRQLLAMMFILVGLAFSANAAEVNRIGIVDIQRIMENSEAGKKAQAEFKSQGEKMQATLKDRGTEIDELRKRLEREALVMDKGMREEKEREYRIKLGDLKALDEKYKQEIQILNARRSGRIQEQVLRLVEKIGKQDGYLLILEKREAGVLYAPNAIDITDQLIPQLTADFVKLD